MERQHIGILTRKSLEVAKLIPPFLHMKMMKRSEDTVCMP